MVNFRYTGDIFDPSGRSSRYAKARVVERDGVLSLETWEQALIEERDDDFYLRLNPFMKWRLDLLAKNYYGDQHLWWVIAFANNIVDPLLELNSPTAPVVLRIPSPKTVRSKVLR